MMLLSDLKIVNGKVVLKNPMEELLHNKFRKKNEKTETKDENLADFFKSIFGKGFK